MIVAGIGCRRGTGAAVIKEVVAAALTSCGLARERLDALATHASKREEPGLCELAEDWSLPVLAFTTDQMQDHSESVETVSERVVELKGVPSVAEAAALAGAGKGARLLAARVANGEATCAIAEGTGRREEASL
jgi:cobalt-precorrin 5A hydrolase